MSALVLQSDFGLDDGAVSAMYGVAVGVDPALRIHDVTHNIPPYDIWEGSYRLAHQAAVTLKYLAVLPPVLLFVTTTRPPEFASVLARIGVPARIAYAVSLALRYVPDIQRDLRTVSQAQQARGINTSRAVPLRTRLRNLSAVLMPLLLGTFDRIEEVSAAMELRGFGRERGRTWFVRTPLRPADLLVIALAVLLVVVPIVLLGVNGGRYWNPFG